MSGERLLTGNEAVAWAVARAGAQVVSAYPITPQTTIIETVAQLVQKEICRAEFVPVESEHSALAACIGAAQAGARTFTATSGQGLALMHELMHWAAGARLPIVLADVNRAMAPGWNIWSDQNDSLSQRDTGWIQLYCEDGQEVMDTVLQAFALAPRLSLPVMVVLDAFFLSHTAEAVAVPDEGEVRDLIPPWEAPWRIDLERPAALGSLVPSAEYSEMRRQLAEAHRHALGAIEDLAATWRERFGRGAGLLACHACEDAEEILVASGTAASTARAVVDGLRARGRPVGLVKVRTFRPFPTETLRKVLRAARRVTVLDRNCSYGASGVFFQEVRAALYGLPGAPPVHGFIAGMGGRDVTPTTIEAALSRAAAEAPRPESTWLTE
ncbi:MAG TPA: transketolase C-terminal domain-containing protein [Anaeromyxobacteraceae bacterium]|nr:transketolase C-terminal domain-containing protein [Anaeromyxobacteraceae bacterium]